MLKFCLLLFAYIAFLIFLRFRTSNEYTEWDLATTTISDYTMLYRIPEKIFNEFKDKIYPTQQRQNMRQPISSGLHKQKRGRGDSDEDIEDYKQESLVYAFK